MRVRTIAISFMMLMLAWFAMSQAALVNAAPTPPAPVQNQPTPVDPNAPVTPQPNPAQPTPDTNAGPSFEIKATCPSKIGVLTWIACPIINTLTDAISSLAKLVVELLKIRPLSQDSNLFNAWKEFRDLADIAFIFVFMFIIFGTVTSYGNYQIKSILPKLILAAVMVQLSFYIAAFAIDIGNILGGGLNSLFNSLAASAPGAAGGSTAPAELLSGAAIGIGAIITGYIVGLPIILLMLLSFLLSVLATFVTLAARQLLIAILIIGSPLAFAAWILPNTENIFKLWYKNLIRVILLYPLIVVVLSVAGIITKAAQTTGGVTGQVNVILASLIPILAFAAIPATFKLASGFMGSVSAIVFRHHDRAKGGLKNSQLVKDMQQTRKEKGFLAQRDAPSKLGRAAGRVQAGQLGFGKQAVRRRVSGYDAALAAQVKDWGSYFDDRQWGNADVYGLATTQVGGSYTYTDPQGTTREYKNPSKAMRVAAVARFTGSGGNVEAARMYKQIFDPKANNYRGDFQKAFGLEKREVTDIWFRGLGQGGGMQSIMQAVPPVNPGKLNTVFDTISPTGVGGIHGEAADMYYDRIMAPVLDPTGARSVDDLRRERMSNALSNFIAVANSPVERSRVDANLMKFFKDHLTPGRPGYDPAFRQLMEQTQKDFQKKKLNGVEFFDTYVDQYGKINIR